MTKRNGWEVKRALHQMHGMEHCARLLIGELDRAIVDRDSYGIRDNPRAAGIAVSATLHCALFCEYAIKTGHAFFSNGEYYRGHLLAGRTDGELGLYDHLEKRFMNLKKVPSGELSKLIIEQMNSLEACCPREWFSGINDVRETLIPASSNFDDWRYGYVEVGQLYNGVPKGVFAVAKGLELFVRRRYLNSVSTREG